MTFPLHLLSVHAVFHVAVGSTASHDQHYHSVNVRPDKGSGVWVGKGGLDCSGSGLRRS